MNNRCSLIVLVFLLIGLGGCGKQAAERKLTFDQGRGGRLTAVVEAVDAKARTVTIRGEHNRPRALKVVKEAGSLDRIRVGDTVEVEYFEYLLMRKTGKEEAQGPAAAIAGMVEPGEKPEGPRLTEAATSAQVVAIDRVRGAATLRMPDRSVLVVRARQPVNIKRLGIGDTVILTASAVEAISIVPAR